MTQDNAMTPSTNTALASAIDELAERCFATSSRNGFHSDDALIMEILNDLADCNAIEQARKWFIATTEQAEIARMHSELSEGLESVRKDPDRPDQHLPQFSNRTVEYADTIIRILDTCAKRGLPIGDALIAKMAYNASRPYKHGKNS